MLTKVRIVEEQLDKQKESNRTLETEMKKCFNEISKLGKIVQASPEVNAEQMRKGIAEAGGMETEPN